MKQIYNDISISHLSPRMNRVVKATLQRHRKSLIINDRMSFFETKYRSCDGDRQINKIIILVAPELFFVTQ